VKLSKTLLAEPVRSAVITDLVEAIDQEVGGKKGLSGTAVKAGYSTASKVVPNLTERGVKRMYPDFARALDPYWADFQAAGGGDFGSYLASRGPEAAEALLAISDSKVQATSRETLKKAYKPLRGKAGSHVEAALPRLGAVIQRHVG
jgi:hypothetical protein